MTDRDLTLEDVTTDYPRVPMRCERCDRVFIACFPEEVLCNDCENTGGALADAETKRDPARRLHSEHRPAAGDLPIGSCPLVVGDGNGLRAHQASIKQPGGWDETC